MATPGGQAGFFSGLLGGVGEGLLSAQKQKHDDELKKNAALSQVYLKAIENGDIEPQHGIPLFANILSSSFSSLTGDKKGSKQDKNFFSEVLGDPEKLSGLLLGFHKATNSSPASGPAGPTGLPTAGPTGSRGGQEGTPEATGTELASRSGSMGVPPRTSIFRSPADRQREADSALTHSEDIRRKSNVQQAGDIEQVKYDTKLKTAQKMVADGVAKDMPEALERVGLKEPKPPTPPKALTPGSSAQIVQDAIDSFESANGRPPTSDERRSIAEKELKNIADAKKAGTSSRSKLTGEALQAYDMNQMLAGLDPETGKKPEDPAESQRLMAAGQEMKRERQAKISAATVRINMAGAKESDKKADAKEIAQGIINGDQPPDLSRLYGSASAVRAELERQGFPLQKALVDWNATQRYVSSLNGPGQLRFRQAIGAMDGYLDSIDSLAQEWKAGKFPALNRASLVAAKNGLQGAKAQQIATRLETQIADATADLAVIYKGGGAATSDALKLASQNLQSNWTESQLRSNLALIRQNMKIRQGSLNPGAQGATGTVPGTASGSPAAAAPDSNGQIQVGDFKVRVK